MLLELDGLQPCTTFNLLQPFQIYQRIYMFTIYASIFPQYLHGKQMWIKIVSSYCWYILFPLKEKLVLNSMRLFYCSSCFQNFRNIWFYSRRANSNVIKNVITQKCAELFFFAYDNSFYILININIIENWSLNWSILLIFNYIYIEKPTKEIDKKMYYAFLIRAKFKKNPSMLRKNVDFSKFDFPNLLSYTISVYRLFSLPKSST